MNQRKNSSQSRLTSQQVSSTGESNSPPEREDSPENDSDLQKCRDRVADLLGRLLFLTWRDRQAEIALNQQKAEEIP